MKLSDVMSAMQLAGFAEVALVIFFAVFIAVTVHTFHRDRRALYERARSLPLEDDEPRDPGDSKENG
jgi:cbb3-type cytochrome oxidase subunit 3